MGMPKPITWSFSRLDKYRQCPKRYKFQYLEKQQEPKTDALFFGTMLHSVLEDLYQWVIDEEHQGPWPDPREITEMYKSTFARSGVSDRNLFGEGLKIVHDYIQRNPVADSRRVLSAEQGFTIDVMGTKVRGYIDRIDRMGDDGVMVVDYKSNRMLYDRDELDSHLQLSIYAMAARKLYPWAKRVGVGFYMLRHNTMQLTERSEEQLELDAHYVQTLAKQATVDRKFEARLGPLCSWCGFRKQCDQFQGALAGGDDMARAIEGMGLDDIVTERERVKTVSKLAAKRADELDEVIKNHLSENETLEAGGMKYEMTTVTYRDYDVGKTVKALTELTPYDADHVRDSITVVNNRKLNAFVDGLDRDTTDVGKLRLKLATVATEDPRMRLKGKKAT